MVSESGWSLAISLNSPFYNGTVSIGGRMWQNIKHTLEARRDLVAGLFSGQISVPKQPVSLIFMALGPMDIQGSEDRIHGLYLSASVYISVCRLSSI